MENVGIWKLLKSKRFWSALLGVALALGLDLSPEEMEAILMVIGLLVGGYSLQDAAAAYRK